MLWRIRSYRSRRTAEPGAAADGGRDPGFARSAVSARGVPGRAVPTMRGEEVMNTGAASNAVVVYHWYDFLCPFCYVAQHRNAILVRHGLQLVELPFQAHPDIPPGGTSAGARNGPVYSMLE